VFSRGEVGQAERVTDDIKDMPEPQRDPEPERAPGGADADPYVEADVGATEPEGEVLTPDPPFSAQQDQAEVPDAIQEPENEEPEEQATDNTEGSAPSG
jgi:hypothetical protein